MSSLRLLPPPPPPLSCSLPPSELVPSPLGRLPRLTLHVGKKTDDALAAGATEIEVTFESEGSEESEEGKEGGDSEGGRMLFRGKNVEL